MYELTQECAIRPQAFLPELLHTAIDNLHKLMKHNLQNKV